MFGKSKKVVEEKKLSSKDLKDQLEKSFEKLSKSISDFKGSVDGGNAPIGVGLDSWGSTKMSEVGSAVTEIGKLMQQYRDRTSEFDEKDQTHIEDKINRFCKSLEGAQNYIHNSDKIYKTIALVKPDSYIELLKITSGQLQSFLPYKPPSISPGKGSENKG